VYIQSTKIGRETYEILNKASMCLYHLATFPYSYDGTDGKAEKTAMSSFEAWYLNRSNKNTIHKKQKTKIKCINKQL